MLQWRQNEDSCFPRKQLRPDLESFRYNKKSGGLMRARQYTEEQIIAVLEEAEAGIAVPR